MCKHSKFRIPHVDWLVTVSLPVCSLRPTKHYHRSDRDSVLVGEFVLLYKTRLHIGVCERVWVVRYSNFEYKIINPYRFPFRLLGTGSWWPSVRTDPHGSTQTKYQTAPNNRASNKEGELTCTHMYTLKTETCRDVNFLTLVAPGVNNIYDNLRDRLWQQSLHHDNYFFFSI